MNKTALTVLLLVGILFSHSIYAKDTSNLQIYKADNPLIRYMGRIDFSNPQKPKITGAGSYFQLKFRGSNCTVLIRNQNLYHYHNYISVVIDETYLGRIRIDSLQTRYQLASNLKDTVHTLLVCKATEAQIGYIEFSGVECEEILPLNLSCDKKIEFVGNSITCGMGLELSAIPCDSGAWYDQHDAYLAFGPIIARKLDADWLLSSVSGIGIERNWNSSGPTLPQVYFNLYLNTDSSLTWKSENYQPDLISVCLGTNDFSDGDGSYQRGKLDSTAFVSKYIRFIKEIRLHHPSAQICCLTSPTVFGEKGVRLNNYISSVITHFKTVEEDNRIHMYSFKQPYIKGCSGHPDKMEHQLMAAELLPFFKQVMNW